MNKVTTVSRIEKDEELTVSIKTVHKIKVYPYDCICGNEELTMELKPFPDLYKIFGNFTRPAIWFWWTLVDVRNRSNNIAFYKAKNNLEAKKITKAYKELSDLNLIIRTEQKHYLINPQAVMPYFKELDRVRDNWDTLNDAQRIKEK